MVGKYLKPGETKHNNLLMAGLKIPFVRLDPVTLGLPTHLNQQSRLNGDLEFRYCEYLVNIFGWHLDHFVQNGRPSQHLERNEIVRQTGKFIDTHTNTDRGLHKLSASRALRFIQAFDHETGQLFERADIFDDFEADDYATRATGMAFVGCGGWRNEKIHEIYPH